MRDFVSKARMMGLMLAVLAGIGSLQAAIEWSEDMQRLLPEGEYITLNTRDGRSWTGRLEAETPEQVTLHIETGTLAFQRNFAAEDIVERAPADWRPVLADRLLAFDEERTSGWGSAQVRRLLGLFDEWIEQAGDHPEHAAILERRGEWAQTLEQLDLGMEKIDGRWMDPIQASAWQYVQISQRMAAMEERFRGIAGDGFSGPPRAQEHYQELERSRREIASGLPAIAAQRTATLLAQARFDAAVEETMGFLRFWLRRIHEPGERRRAGRRAARQEAPEASDLHFFVRLQQQIMEAYNAAWTDPAPPETVEEETMVFVPGGFFLMGNEQGQPGDMDYPPRVVHVEHFWIDRYEVTNAEYRSFVDYVRQTGDYSMAHPDAPPMKNHEAAGWQFPELSADDQPVVGVDWFDAYAYARWVGKRLPTEAEWELAARGRDRRTYPWGEAAPRERLVNSPSGRLFAERQLPAPTAAPPAAPRRGWSAQHPDDDDEDRPGGPRARLAALPWHTRSLGPREISSPSEEHADLSPFGVLHMGGNVAEWVYDRFGRDYYTAAPTYAPRGPQQGEHRVFRGGSYLDEDEALFTYSRRHSGQQPSFRRGLAANGRPLIGFRCARSVETGAPRE